MPMNWTAEADRKLFLSIINTQDVKVDSKAVAAELECTPRAVEERLKKLKKMAKEEAGSTGDDQAGPATKAKAKPKPKPKAKTATRRKRGAEDEDDLVVPAKKARLPSKGKNKGGKAAEVVTEDEDRLKEYSTSEDEPIDAGDYDLEDYNFFA